jgi:hypothetical protein
MKGTVKAAVYASVTLVVTTLALMSEGAPLSAVSQRDPLVENAPGSGDSMGPVLSRDGRYVVFSSSAPDLVPAQSPVSTRPVPGVLGLYMRDRLTGQTTLLSSNVPGINTSLTSVSPIELSPDNRYLLLETGSMDDSPGASGRRSDVWLFDLTTGSNALVNLNTNGVSSASRSDSGAMTPDGRFVAFVSSGRDLAPNDTNSGTDIFVRDRQLGITLLASPNATSGASYDPLISTNGRYVLFFSTAQGMTPPPDGASGYPGDIYLRDLVAGSTLQVSTNARTLVPSSSTASCANHRLSADGNYVVYSLLNYLFQLEVSTDITTIITSNALLSSWAIDYGRTLDMSADGRFVTFVSSANTNVYCWDRLSGITGCIATNSSVSNLLFESPSMTPDGRYVLVSSPVSSGNYNLLRWDTATGIVTPVTIDTAQATASVNPLAVSISTNGQTIAFDTVDSNLTATDRNHAYDVFARDLTRSTNEFVSIRNPANVPLTGNALSSSSGIGVSSNGQFMVFTSRADDLIPNYRNTNSMLRIFVRDLGAGTNQSVQTPEDWITLDPAISGNGVVVAFTGFASNTHDIWQYTRSSGLLSLASAATNGLAHTNVAHASSLPAIDGDGRFILFHSTAPDISPGVTGTADNLYVHDNAANTNFALTTNNGFVSAYLASLSPNGILAAYVSSNSTFLSTLEVFALTNKQKLFSKPVNSATAISLGNSKVAYLATNQLWVLDLATSNTIRATTATLTRPSALNLSADGQFVVFSTKQSLVGTDGRSNPDIYLFDTVGGTNMLISVNYTNGRSAQGASDWAQISSNNRFVAYVSSAPDIVPGDTNGSSDIFLYDRITKTTTLVSTDASGSAPSSEGSFLPRFSADAKSLFFGSWSGNMVAGDYNQSEDIFIAGLTSPAITDSDHDGMDDTWEIDFFGSLSRDGAGDFDGDGASDLAEFLAGTDPSSGGSYLHLTLSKDASGATALMWTAAPQRKYRIEFKTNLADPDWIDLAAPITVLGANSYAYDATPTSAQRFYRLVITN